MGFNYWAKFEDGQFYHVYNRGVNGCNLFYRAYNYDYFLDKWTHYFHPFLKVYAYCLMPNHFHFLVSPDESSIQNFDQKSCLERKILIQRVESVRAGHSTFNEFLELQMKDFFGSYSKAINKQQGRTGSLFQQRFKRVLISSEWQLIHKICYIHHNPIHHRFCRNYEVWAHSSYNSFVDNKFIKLQLAPTLDLFCSAGSATQAADSQIQKLNSFMKVHADFREIPDQTDAIEFDLV